MARSMAGRKWNDFGLRCSLSGDDREIRAIAALAQPEGAFVSVCTEQIVVWKPEKDAAAGGGTGYSADPVVRSHCNVVHSLLSVAPSDDHPLGLILIGTDEPSIKAYDVQSPDQPIYTLKEHSDTVCSLASGRFGTMVSGSMDKTAKVWHKQKCTMTLSGHVGAVLSIRLMPVGGYMLTGSADSTIKRWKAGKCEHTFQGHTDWVRAICVLDQSEFLSCSNDGTVRRWNIHGDFIQTYTGHSGKVSDLACLPDGKGFVSVGDDGKIIFWKDGAQIQVLLIQKSLSSVCVLSNQDIVTTASANIIRVFTTDPECIAVGVAKEITDAVHPETVSTEKKEETESRPTSAEKIPSSDSSSSRQQLAPGEYFPETSFIKFDKLNRKGVFSKLREFNYEVLEENQINKAEMEHLELLISGLSGGEAQEGAFQTLWKLLSWTRQDLLFPTLDILRYTMLNEHVSSHMCTSEDGRRFIDYISSILSTSSTPPRNQILALRALSNTFQHDWGERLLLPIYDNLATYFLQFQSESEPQLQIAQSSLLLNFVIAFCRANDTEGKMRCLCGAVTLSQWLTDSEAYFRLLVAIGTAVIGDRACCKLARTLDLQNFFNMCCCDDLEKVRSAAERLTKIVA